MVSENNDGDLIDNFTKANVIFTHHFYLANAGDVLTYFPALMQVLDLEGLEIIVDEAHTWIELCTQLTMEIGGLYNEVVKGEKVTGNMESFVEKITPSINKNGTVDDAIHNNIDSVVKEVSEDESIKLLIDQGKVKVIGAYYDLGGKVTFYE